MIERWEGVGQKLEEDGWIEARMGRWDRESGRGGAKAGDNNRGWK